MRVMEYVKRMETTEFTRRQAEVSVEVLHETVKGLVTKADLQQTAGALRSEMQSMERSLRRDIADAVAMLRADMKDLATELRAEIRAAVEEVRGDFKTQLGELRQESRVAMLEHRRELKEELQSNLAATEGRIVIRLAKIMGGTVLVLGSFIGTIMYFVK